MTYLWRHAAAPTCYASLLQTTTRWLIADDHEVVRSGLRSLIESQTDWEVVAEAADGKEAVSKAIDTRPDVAVLDYSMPLINGAEVTRDSGTSPEDGSSDLHDTR